MVRVGRDPCKHVEPGCVAGLFPVHGHGIPPIRDMAEKYNIMQAAMAAAERVFMLLDEQPTVVDPANPRRWGKSWGTSSSRMFTSRITRTSLC